MSKTYKQRKEDFVSNHYGGTISEINFVTAVAPAAYILYSVLQSRLRFFTPYGSLQFFFDFLLNAVAILFATTVYSSYPALLNVLILSPAIFIYFTTRAAPQRIVPVGPKTGKDKDVESSGHLEMPKKAFLTVYRGAMMMVTCISILAVDFKVFPRRFAKVENWGTSLMDLGVGSFVFSSGVVSARVVLKELDAFVQAQKRNEKYNTLTAGKRIQATIKSTLPLLVLGFIRLASVKSTGYAEHITEYGYHWNFFFTLALLPPFVHIFQSLLFFLPPRLLTISNLPFIYSMLSVLVASAYQILLETTGLKKFVLVGEREQWGLIGWNKEGIFSFFGYLAIFLAGMSAGGYLLPASHEPASGKKSRFGPLSKSLLQWSIFWIAIFLVTSEWRGLGLQVSRRLANLPYVLWIAAFNTSQLMAFYLIDYFFIGRGKGTEEENYRLATPMVLEAFNKEGLPIFLLANVLTGVINLSINTLDMDNRLAVAVLVGYVFVLTCAATGLGMIPWRTKFGGYLGL
ncbi:GWT1-domain-containing protein [Kalaharituber pfeilii]|nr:GWT1-domain-containing protein [Kalaharituber pfeilii]